MVDFEWSVHRNLFTTAEQHYQEFMIRQQLAEKGITGEERSKKMTTLLNWPGKLYASKTNSNAWFQAGESDHYKNLTYGLSVDPITFLDRAVVAIAEYKANTSQ